MCGAEQLVSVCYYLYLCVFSTKRREIEASCVGLNNWCASDGEYASTAQVGVASYLHIKLSNQISPPLPSQRNRALIYGQ